MAANDPDSDKDLESLVSDESSSDESDVDSATKSQWGFHKGTMDLKDPAAFRNHVGDTSPDGANDLRFFTGTGTREAV